MRSLIWIVDPPREGGREGDKYLISALLPKISTHKFENIIIITKPRFSNNLEGNNITCCMMLYVQAVILTMNFLAKLSFMTRYMYVIHIDSLTTW